VFRYLPAALTLSLLSTPVAAQAAEGWVYRLEGAYFNQSDTDLSGGGSFAADRKYTRFGAFHRNSGGLSFGVSATLGRSDYDFSGGTAPWGNVTENAVSVTVSGAMANGGRWFVAPSVRSRYASGASVSDGQSAGVFGGISWQVNDRLAIGPAFGAFTGLGNDDNDVFPALLLDWRISDRLSLTTGPTIGASQGPGLSMRYDMSSDWAVTLSARSEKSRFALSNSGATPGGVGQDSSIPVVVSVSYEPNPGMSFAAFAGAEVDGMLEVENAAGATVSKTRYDAAPLVGLAFSLSF
jgi:hypothetical protein